MLPSKTGLREDPHRSLGWCWRLMLRLVGLRPPLPGPRRRLHHPLETNTSSPLIRPSPSEPRSRHLDPLEPIISTASSAGAEQASSVPLRHNTIASNFPPRASLLAGACCACACKTESRSPPPPASRRGRSGYPGRRLADAPTP